jgi:hypothetical protein
MIRAAPLARKSCTAARPMAPAPNTVAKAPGFKRGAHSNRAL